MSDVVGGAYFGTLVVVDILSFVGVDVELCVCK